MNRRSYLAAVLGSATGGLAGCAASVGSDTGTETGSSSSPVVGTDGNPSNICERSPRPEYIPAIVDPEFDRDYSGIAASLEASTPVIGIERDGEARAYPIEATSEMVNDSFGDPILVTYCPLCASGLTALRRVDGRETVFENTGYTWTPPNAAGEQALEEDRVFGVGFREDPGEVQATNDPNLVMFDRETGSYWSQLLGQAICGPLAGERLSLLPSTVADWGTWRDRHPETTVLLPPPHSTTVASA